MTLTARGRALRDLLIALAFTGAWMALVLAAADWAETRRCHTLNPTSSAYAYYCTGDTP